MTTGTMDFVPALRPDIVRRDIGGQALVWSPLAAEPSPLDPVASVMFDVVDGRASIGELASEVHEEIGVPLERARHRVTEIIDRFDRAGLLVTSRGEPPPSLAVTGREVFVSTATPCSENASRVGTKTLNLRFGAQDLRVACDSARGARVLRNALTDHLIDSADDAPLAFVLTAPQGLRRSHELIDRAGFVLSKGRGLETGLRALAAHLTAFLPLASGTVRIRARAVLAGDRTVVCLAPLLFAPVLGERDLSRAGLRIVDRLVLDVDCQTGQVVNPEIPWPTLADLRSDPGHVGTGGRRTVDAVVAASPTIGLGSSAPVDIAAQVAANGLAGSPAELVDAAAALVQHGARMTTPARLTQLLQELARSDV